MRIRKFWPTIWIALCALCELTDRFRQRSSGKSRYLDRRQAAEQRKRPSRKSS
jgi:hypothetical protein